MKCSPLELVESAHLGQAGLTQSAGRHHQDARPDRAIRRVESPALVLSVPAGSVHRAIQSQVRQEPFLLGRITQVPVDLRAGRKTA